MVSLVTHALRDPAQVERNLISRVLVEGMEGETNDLRSAQVFEQ